MIDDMSENHTMSTDRSEAEDFRDQRKRMAILHSEVSRGSRERVGRVRESICLGK